MASRTSTPEPSTARPTQTQTTTQPAAQPLVLRLRGAHSRRIQWAEDVIDNEGLGRKKSKVCCIYHKPRDVGESSSEDDSSDDDRARPTKHDHDHDGCGKGKGKGKRKPSPNAYEKMPKYDVKK